MSPSRFDAKELDTAYFQRRRQGVRDRLLAGLLTSLQSHAGVQTLYVNLENKPSEAFLMAPTVKEFYEQAKSGWLPEGAEALWDSFYRSMASTRKATNLISGTSKDHLRECLPAFFGGRPFERSFLMLVCEELLEDPAMILDDKGLSEIRSLRLEQVLPQAESRPGVRL